MSGARILGVCGTSQPDSRTRQVLELALDAARAAGAEVKVLDLSETVLPIMVEGDRAQAELPEVQLVRETAEWAQGFVLATPEYHGSMSGALKNWFDFLWQQLAGTVAGVVAVTGAGHAEKAVHTVKTCCGWCHGWVLPYHVAARWEDFDDAGQVASERVCDRLLRIGHDVARYAPLVHDAYAAARSGGKEPASGFAGM